MKIEMNPNEMVVKAADSSYLNNGNTIKGKLILTTQRLYFNPEINGSQSKHVEIYPNEIEDVMFFKDRPIMPSGLNIITKDGTENKFLVKKRSAWNAMIVKMC
ncbi:MAG: hypothetical protein K8S16_07910 [Bacteroidales bacterium]|nr:hypothetical protein [Bacteroidales bacterium]